MSSCAMRTTYAVISSPTILAAIAPIHRWVSGQAAIEPGCHPRLWPRRPHRVALYHTALSPPQSVPDPSVLPDGPITEQKPSATTPTVTNLDLKINPLLMPRPHLSFSRKLQLRQLVGQSKETPRLEHEDRWQHPPPLGTGVEGGDPKSGCSGALLLQSTGRIPSVT